MPALFCLGDEVAGGGTDPAGTGFQLRFVAQVFDDGAGGFEYGLAHGVTGSRVRSFHNSEADLTLVARGIGPRMAEGDTALFLHGLESGNDTHTHLVIIFDFGVKVVDGVRVWTYRVTNIETGAFSSEWEIFVVNPDGSTPPDAVPCGPQAACTLVERDSLGSGVVLSGVTTGIGFLETVTLVATIEGDPDRLAPVTWQASHGDIATQDYNTAVWLSPNFETPAIVAVFIGEDVELACRATFQTPPVPTGTPGLLSCLHIEEAPRASGRIFSGVMSNLEPGQTISLVATILLDDGRRDNVVWRAQNGTIDFQQWDLATYTAPTGAGVDVVDIIIDDVVQFQARCLFSIPSAPLAAPDLTQLEDFLHVDFWKTLAWRMSQGVEQTREGIPNDIKDARDFLGGLAQQGLDNVAGLPGQITDLLGPEFQTASFNILAGMENVMEPIMSAAFNPIQAAIQALPIPTAGDLATAWGDILESALAPALKLGVKLTLEAIETAIATIGAPLFERILMVPDLPDYLRSWIEELINPTAQAAALLGQSAGSAVVSGSIAGVIAPGLRAVEHWANRQGPNQLNSANEMVTMHLKGLIDHTQLIDEIANLGINQIRADLLTELLLPRLDPNSINQQVLRWEMQQAAASAGSLAQGLAAEFAAGTSPEDAKFLYDFLGFENSTQDKLLDQRKVLPQIQDLIRFAVREAFDPELRATLGLDDDFPSEILPFTAGQGLPTEFTRMFWASHWELPSIQQGFEMLHRVSFSQQFTETMPTLLAGGTFVHPVIDDEGLDLLFREADILPFWRERLKAISFSVVTRVDVRRMYDMGIFSLEQVEATYRSLGYTREDSASLTQFVERLAIQPRLTARNTEARQQYRDGLIDRTQAEALLRPLIHLDVELAEELTTLDLDRQGTRLAREVTSWQTAFRKDLVSEAEFRSELSRLTIPPEEIDFRIDLILIARGADDPTPEQEELRAAGRGIVIRRFREGLVEAAQFDSEMSSLGYTDNQIGQFRVQADLEFDTNMSLDLLAAYRAGLRTGRLSEEEFRGNLQTLGIRPELINGYIEFDQLRRKLEGPTGEEAEIRALGSGPVISRFQEGWTQAGEFALEMESLGYTTPEVDRYQVLADLRFDFDFKQDSLAVLRAAFNRGEITGDEFLSRLATLGMDPDRAQVHLAREQLRLLDRAEPSGAAPALPGG